MKRNSISLKILSIALGAVLFAMVWISMEYMAAVKESDISLGWNLILVNREHLIPKDYKVELTELSNGEKVDSRIYPELQEMFNDARAAGLDIGQKPSNKICWMIKFKIIKTRGTQGKRQRNLQSNG